MDETKVTGRLPNLDMTIVRRKMPDEQAEVVTVNLKATPSLRAVAGTLATNPALPAAMLMAAPLLLWGSAVQAAWRPWLGWLPSAAPATPQLEAPDGPSDRSAS